ncbi:MAG TPA: hypothetical protein DDZ88_07370 [Verrucomicrobiales bacterium]|nr:hypothetical protein [Verrucomicrobiales bacterium]
MRLFAILALIASRLLSRRRQTESQVSPFIGNPFSDMSALDGAQAFPDTCAIKAQEVILQQFFNADFDESKLRQAAFENGWYNPGEGTPCEHVGRLLEQAGIPISQKISGFAELNGCRRWQ